MSMNMGLGENISSLLDNLEKFLQAKTVLSEPITIGNTTMVVCNDICFGLGSGSTEKNSMDKKGCSGVGNGTGAGVRVNPIAVIIIQDNKVQLMPISVPSSLNKLIEGLPEILQKLNLSPEILNNIMTKLKSEKSEKDSEKATEKNQE